MINNKETTMKQIALNFYQFNHAVRTPLTGILGLAGLLEQEHLTPQQSRRIHGILQAGREMLRFIEKLEAKKPTSSAQPCMKKVEKFKSNKKKTILLVEDHPIIQQVHTAMLSNLGFAVDVAASGKKALEKFNSEHISFFFWLGIMESCSC